MDDKPNNLNVIEFAIKRVNDKNEKSLNNAIESYKQTIRDAEGLELEAYKPDEDEEQFTIGYGRYGVEEGMTITEEEAEERGIPGIRPRMEKVSELLKKYAK